MDASSSLCNWTASVTSGGTWLSITSGASGADGGNLIIEFTANETGASRTGTIRVTAPGAEGSPKDVTVIQLEGGPNLTPYKPDDWSDKIVTSTITPLFRLGILKGV